MTSPLLVACLCADWCGTCRDYRPVVEQQAAAFGARFIWLDIEDDEALVEGIDVDDFPTVLIGRGDDVLFFGPLTPQPQTVARLLQAAREGDLAPQHVDRAVARLWERLGRDAA